MKYLYFVFFKYVFDFLNGHCNRKVSLKMTKMHVNPLEKCVYVKVRTTIHRRFMLEGVKSKWWREKESERDWVGQTYKYAFITVHTI